MSVEEIRRRSRFMLRALEWDDPKARYPNLWLAGMPVRVQAVDTVAMRLRLGDLVACYHPTSLRRPERSERFVGIARVAGLSRAETADRFWIDLETAHRFAVPFDAGGAPRRVFLCCDPGWPEPDVRMFEAVFAQAVAEGWSPLAEECATPAEPAADIVPAAQPRNHGPLFAGLAVGTDLHDPRDGTWLAVVQRDGPHTRVVRLEATGRHGLGTHFRDPDRDLQHVQAIGCAFPLGFPHGFVDRLLGEAKPDDDWWHFAGKFARVSYPDFLQRLHEYREAEGEALRLTDERASTPSPLSRAGVDPALQAFHGIRLMAVERSRFAVRPFERAQARLLLEVRPDPQSGADELQRLRIEAGPAAARCRTNPAALRAVLAAARAAAAVESGEAERTPEELAPDDPGRLRREGWIYGAAGT